MLLKRFFWRFGHLQLVISAIHGDTSVSQGGGRGGGKMDDHGAVRGSLGFCANVITSYLEGTADLWDKDHVSSIRHKLMESY